MAKPTIAAVLSVRVARYTTPKITSAVTKACNSFSLVIRGSSAAAAAALVAEDLSVAEAAPLAVGTAAVLEVEDSSASS